MPTTKIIWQIVFLQENDLSREKRASMSKPLITVITAIKGRHSSRANGISVVVATINNLDLSWEFPCTCGFFLFPFKFPNYVFLGHFDGQFESETNIY